MGLIKQFSSLVYSSTFCIHVYRVIHNHNIIWKTIFNYSLMDVHNFFYNSMVAHAGRMLANVVEFAFTFDNCILSNNSWTFSVLPHFAYMAIRALTTTTFDAKPFSTTLWWMSIPSSRAPMVAHAGRMIAKVTKFGFTFDICICLKVYRARKPILCKSYDHYTPWNSIYIMLHHIKDYVVKFGSQVFHGLMMSCPSFWVHISCPFFQLFGMSSDIKDETLWNYSYFA